MKLYILAFIAFAILSPLAFARKAVFAGGGLDDNNTDVYGAFVSLSTPDGQEPYIGIITAASDPTDAEDNGAFYINIFQSAPLHVQNIEWLPIDINHTSNADDATLAAKLENMTGVFFGGGDQERLITCFYRNGREDTVTLAAIRSRYEAGLMAIGGTSAGTTIMQATPMVSGGESWDGLAYGAFNASDAEDSDALTYDAGGGFRFFDYGFLDTHFATRGREGRMIRLMSDLSANGTFGIGIDENTALVRNEDTYELVGYNGAFIYDYSQVDLKQNGPEGAFSVNNIKISYLSKGDVFNSTDGTITFASFKQDIKGREQNTYPMNPTIDIFSSLNNFDQNGDRMFPEMFTNVTTNLFNSAASNTTHGYTWETNPGFRVDFTKDEGSSGVIGVSEGVTYISYSKLTVSLNCVSNCGNSFLNIKKSQEEKKDKPVMSLQEVVGNMELPAFLFGEKAQVIDI